MTKETLTAMLKNKFTVTKETLATKLNGREISNEILGFSEMRAAAWNNLAVVRISAYGMVYIAGAIKGECWVKQGQGRLKLLLYKKFDEWSIEDMTEQEQMKQEDIEDNTWEMNVYSGIDGYSYSIETNIPHSTFDFMDGGSKYSRGIVFHLDDLEDPEELKITKLEKSLGWKLRIASYCYLAGFLVYWSSNHIGWIPLAAVLVLTIAFIVAKHYAEKKPKLEGEEKVYRLWFFPWVVFFTDIDALFWNLGLYGSFDLKSWIYYSAIFISILLFAQVFITFMRLLAGKR